MLSIQTYRKYPDLALLVNEYFSLQESLKGKSLGNFATKLVHEGCVGQDEWGDVLRASLELCEALCRKGAMLRVGTPVGVCANNVYLSDLTSPEKNVLELELNSLAYGFEYIYQEFESLVVPILNIGSEGDQQLGTGFLVPGGIATAKHCLQNARELAIRGFEGKALGQCSILVASDPDIDIAYITGQLGIKKFARIGSGEVPQEVLVMGYPKVPTYDVFLTAERALISSVPTKGAIAAFGKSIFTKHDMMLITARIRGGNSGGPIINEHGRVVGIACEIPKYEDSGYDDVGYGAAVQTSELIRVMQSGVLSNDINPASFVDYPE